MIERYLLAWLPMVVIGVANGVLREATYRRRMSELRAHQVSTVTGVFLFGLYILVGWGNMQFAVFNSRVFGVSPGVPVTDTTRGTEPQRRTTSACMLPALRTFSLSIVNL